MPRLKHRVPRICRDRQQAYMKLDGQRVQLGTWGSPEAQEAYNRTVAEWLANGRKMPAPTPESDADKITITEISVAFTKHVNARQHPNEASNYRSAIRLVRKLYDSEPAISFGPKRLRVVRQAMIDEGWRRSHINKQVSRVRTMFRWAASIELVSESIHRRLCTLEPLRKGEAQKEGRKVRPVTRREVRLVWPHLNKQVRGLVLVQRFTGARADELVRLRATDINTKGEVWTATLSEHKTEHHGHERIIYFGRRAQRVLRFFMVPGRDLTRPLFSPRDAERARYDLADAHRRPGQKPNSKKSDRVLGDHYTTASYRRVIHRACKIAGIPNWSPHQLRHLAGTIIRREFGVEAAQVVLGHSNLKVTELYAAPNQAKAIEAITKIG